MTRKTMKVHRVNSIQEALWFEEQGADIIGVDLRSTGRDFDDGRRVQIELVCRIKSKLTRSRLLGEFDEDEPGRVLEIMHKSGIELLQVDGRMGPSLEIEKGLRNQGGGVIYRLDASYDTDPSWILARFKQEPPMIARIFELQLLTDVKNSWEFMRDRSPEFEEELQVKDIDALAEHESLLLATNFTAENVGEVFELLPHAKGIALTLGRLAAQRYDRHVLEVESAREVVVAASQRPPKHDAHP